MLEAFADDREANITIRSLEQGSAKVIFEIADAATDRRLLDTKRGASLAKAAIVGRRHELAQMTKLDPKEGLATVDLSAC